MKNTFLQWFFGKKKPAKKRKRPAPNNKARGIAPENKMNG
jgi:hypothetical protein